MRAAGRETGGLLGLCLVVAMMAAGACKQGPESPRPDAPGQLGHQPGGSGSAAPGPSGGTGTSASEQLERLPLAKAQQVELPATILPVVGERSALLLTTDLLHRQAHVRRIDHRGRVGPIRSMAGRQVVDAFDTQTHPLLLTSDGKQLCVERLDLANSSPLCRKVSADLATTLDGRLVLFEQRADEEEKSEAPSTKAQPPRKGKRPAPKRTKRTKRSPPKPKVSKQTKMRLWIRPADALTGIAETRVDTGLTFLQPLPAMGLIDALGAGSRAHLLWYDHLKSRREGRQRIARARLRTAQLDRDGKLITKSRSVLLEGDRGYGTIEGHLQPRLFGRGGRVLFLGRFVQTQGTTVTKGWEAKLLAPRTGLTTGPPVVGVDPARLAEPIAITQQGLANLQKTWDLAPRQVEGQRANEAGRVAWVGARGYALIGGRLHQVSRADGEAKAMPAPFVAQRARLHWGVVTPSGAGLALTSDGLVEVSRDGTIRRHPRAPDPGLTEPLGRAVRIADSWWIVRSAPGAGSGAAVVRLLPDPLEAPACSRLAYRDSARLVGGTREGMMLTLHANRLTVWRLSTTGATRQLAVYRSPLAGRFTAVRRGAGGAILAGRSRNLPHRLAVVAIDDRGQLLPVRLSSLVGTATDLGLVALPGGGAWLTNGSRSRVSWIDDDGRELGAAAWPRRRSHAACLDGRPSRTQVPAVEPGKWQSLPKLAGSSSCTSGEPSWATDGSLRWFGTAVQGIDSRAELAIMRPTQASPPKALTGAQGAQSALTTARLPSAGHPPTTGPQATPLMAPTGPAPPCPPDMVHIPSQAGAPPAAGLCIDRFESQLVDQATGVALSPDYPTTPKLTGHVLAAWATGHRRTGNLHARAMPLPPLLRAVTASPKVIARSRAGVIPSGYLSGFTAADACQGAGKRLCTLDEWKRACRGQQDRKFPYGKDYEHGVCNVYRYAHPAATLHGNAAIGHLDPRLNRVTQAGAPMLRQTGATSRCASRWGEDAVYDMVGNLDEWVDKKGGAFAGGFFSRSSRSGCSAAISVHPRRYLDYSLGTRCCLSAKR